MKTSHRSLVAWFREIGDRAMLAVAAENGWYHDGARVSVVAERAAEARARAVRTSWNVRDHRGAA